MTTWCPWRWCHCRRSRVSWRRWRARWRSANASERSSTARSGRPPSRRVKSFSLAVVRGGAAQHGGAEQHGGERDDGAQHGPGAPDGDEERQDAPSAGERAVEVECRHSSLGGGAGGGDRSILRRVVRHGRGAGSGNGGPASPRPGGEALRTGAGLPAVDHGAPAAGLVHGGFLLGEPPLLNGRHAVRT